MWMQFSFFLYGFLTINYKKQYKKYYFLLHFAKSYMILYVFYTSIINFDVILTYVNQFGSAQIEYS